MLGIGMGIVGAKIVHDMMESDKNNEKADRISMKAANQQYAAEEVDRVSRQRFQNSTSKIANRKRAILKSSFPRFVAVYNKIAKIEFNSDTRGIKELFTVEKIHDYGAQLNTISAIEPMQLTDDQLLSCVLVSGAKSMILQSILSGGGLNPVTLVVAGVTESIVKDSELNVSTAKAFQKQAQIYAEAVDAKKDALEAVCWQLDQISDVLAKLNALFLKSISTSSNIIDKNGYFSTDYSDADLTTIGTCMNLAKAIKIIMDTPILDENNRIIEESKEIIIAGRSFIEQYADVI